MTRRCRWYDRALVVIAACVLSVTMAGCSKPVAAAKPGAEAPEAKPVKVCVIAYGKRKCSKIER